MESVSRQTCYQSISNEGLGIVNFLVKCDILILSSVLANSSDNDSKSLYLVKYFLGSRLSSLRSEWSSLRENSSPSAQDLSPFYTNCFSVLVSVKFYLT